jgi:uncharacterized damage-inducible protein DinB
MTAANGPVTSPAELGRLVLATVRHRLVEDFPVQVRACLDVLTDDQVWWRPNQQSNAVGNLVLHLCGSTRFFVGRGVGRTGYHRDRPAEFAARGPMPRAELLRVLDETVAETARIIDALAPDRLAEVTELWDRERRPYTVAALLLRTSHHWAVHAGQIVYATKALREGGVDELWMKTNP